MQVIFFGTALFAVPSLRALAARHRVVVCVTQPDRPQGRGLKAQASPVKRAAEAAGIPVVQPSRVRRSDCEAHRSDVGVVAAYGQLLPGDLLELPPHGMLGVHPSLLPAYRGAAPVAWALLNGDTTTGVTIFRLTEALDAGDILTQRSTPIQPDDDLTGLTDRLARLGAEALLETLEALATGRMVGRPQDSAKASVAPKLTKAQGRIDWSQSADQILRQVRALSDWPGATTTLGGTTLRIWQATRRPASGEGTRSPGVVLAVEPDAVVVATGQGGLAITEVQPAGKRRMPIRAFLAGHPLRVGERLGA